MSQSTTPRSRVQHLATLIENDVRRRGLNEGDAYLTAAEASKDFGVDPFVTTRAMSLLAKRGVLIRKRGIGTFVGHRIDPAHEMLPTLKHIHVLQGISPQEPRWCFPIGQVLQELHNQLPSHQVQSTILPPENPLAFARQLIQQRAEDGSMAGMLLTRCNREIQQFVLEQHVPALVFGSVYSTTKDLPSVDVDQFESGRLAAKHLLDAGHKRVMVLMRENWLPGDNRFIEGITRAMADAGATFDALITRSTCEEVAAVENEVHRLLELGNRPTGLICYSVRFAEIALGVLKSKGLSAPDDLDLIFYSHESAIAAELGLPCVHPKLSSEALSALVAQALKEQLEKKPGSTKHTTLPVELFTP